MKTARHDFLGGWAETASREPHPALRGQVSRYYGWDERTAEPLRRRELPVAEVVVVLTLGSERWDIELANAPAPRARYSSFLGGLHDAPVLTGHEGSSFGIQLNLSPCGAHALLGVPMDSLAHRVVELDDVLGRAGRELVERLHDAPGWSARFDLLDATLGRWLTAPAALPSPSIRWAWERLVATEGRAPIGGLVQQLGCSRTHLLAGFREQIGLPPKRLARLLRFQHAIRRLDR